MKKCLITGASGLIGGHFVNLIKDEWAVTAVSRKEGQGPFTGNILHVKEDIACASFVKALPKKIDAVVSLAQSRHFRDFPDSATDIFAVNTASVAYLLDYAIKAGAKTFILASTGGVTKHRPQESNDTSRKPNSLDHYLNTKLCAEMIASAYNALMNVIIMRFHFVYGPQPDEEKLIPRLVKMISNGDRVTIIGGAEGAKINPIYVSDAAMSIKMALDLEASHTIDIGGPDILTIRQICGKIGEAVQRQPLFDVSDKAESEDLTCDIGQMSELLAPPLVHFNDGLAKIISPLKARQKESI